MLAEGDQLGTSDHSDQLVSVGDELRQHGRYFRRKRLQADASASSNSHGHQREKHHQPQANEERNHHDFLLGAQQLLRGQGRPKSAFSAALLW